MWDPPSILRRGPLEHPSMGSHWLNSTDAPGWDSQSMPGRDLLEHPLHTPQLPWGRGGHCSPHDLGSVKTW